MRIEEHVSLKALTTLKVGGMARYFAAVASVDELKEAFAFAKEKKVPFTVLGGGSNVLIAGGEINRLFIKIEIKGIEWKSPLTKGALHSDAGGLFTKGKTTPASEDGGTPKSSGDIVTAGAGESWDSLVTQAVEKGLWGIENLSGIPGTVGAAPVQNIGAYGAELADVLLWVEALDPATGMLTKLSLGQCGFGYRDSIFKRSEGKGLIITRVALRLSKEGTANLEYKDLGNRISNSQFLISTKTEEKRSEREITPSDIRTAVLEIRGGKFPDLAVYGTAGSFFKNPIISKQKFDELKKKYPALPGFPISSSSNFQLRTSNLELPVKVPLAWILDNICGMRGLTEGPVGLFKNQPIVLVNFGGASAGEVNAFARRITDCVKEKTGIHVEYEVQKIG